MMTGTEFRRHRERTLGLSYRKLADRWGISHGTIQNEEKRDQVRGVYEAAMRWEIRQVEAAEGT